MVKINLKVEHLLIAILIFIGLYLLINQCNCEGFSVGAPFVCDTTTYKCIENTSSSEDPSLDWATDVHLKQLHWSSQGHCEETCKEDKYTCYKSKYTCHLDLFGTQTKEKCDVDCNRSKITEPPKKKLIEDLNKIVDQISGKDLDLSNLLKDLDSLNCQKRRGKDESAGPVFGEDAWEDMIDTIKEKVPIRDEWKLDKALSTRGGGLYGHANYVWRINVPLDDDTGRILRPIVLDCGDENRMYNDPGEKGDCEINFKPGDIIEVEVPPVSGMKRGVTDHFKEEIKEKLRECLEEDKKKEILSEDKIMELYYILKKYAYPLGINTDDLLEKIGHYLDAIMQDEYIKVMKEMEAEAKAKAEAAKAKAEAAKAKEQRRAEAKRQRALKRLGRL